MESIEKLRELALDINSTEIIDHLDVVSKFMLNGDWLDSWHRAFDAACNEIEREISERYMELPVDADGVPIHIGDELDAYGITFTAYAISENYIYNERMLGSLVTGGKHHAEPRTIEDVLMDLAVGVFENDGYDNEDIKRYADELRELMGGE